MQILLTCYVCSTKIGENSNISKCFENFVSQALGVLTRVYAAELRINMNNIVLETKLVGEIKGHFHVPAVSAWISLER